MLERYELTERPSIPDDNSHQHLRDPPALLAMQSSTQAEASDSPIPDNDNPLIEAGLNFRTVLKLDLILLPFVSLLFLLNSLDRSNIGNAETANFTKDAGLQPEDLNIAVACFFAVFVILQPVGAAFGRRYGMAKWVPGCMSLWGFCTAAHVLIRRKWELITIRIMIGILEAGFYPTTVSYLSLFYTRYEFARRLGLFYGQYAVAGALGGVLSYAVFSAYPPDHNHQPQPLTRDDGKEPLISAGQKPWQVLFILEGGLTIFVALLGFLWLPRSAGSAWFLRQDERRWAEQRVMRDRHAAEVSSSTKGESSSQDHVDDTGGANEEITSENERDEEQLRRLLHDVGDPHSASDQRHQAEAPSNSDITSDKGLSRRDVLEAFSDWKIWYLLVVNICSSIPAMAFSVFLPLVVKGLGVDPVRANLLTAPPFVTGAITLWIFAWWSDKKQERMIPILWGLAINLVGLTATVMLAEDAYAARYAALCVLLGGSFIASPLTVSWLTGNIEEPGKRAIVLGINGWGNLAGLFSAMLFSPRHAPHYVIPFYITFALVLFSFVGYIAFRALLIRENRVRAQSVARWAPEEVEHEKRWGTGPFHRRRGMTRIADLIDRWIGRSIWSDNHSDGRRGDDKITFVYGL